MTRGLVVNGGTGAAVLLAFLLAGCSGSQDIGASTPSATPSMSASDPAASFYSSHVATLADAPHADVVAYEQWLSSLEGVVLPEDIAPGSEDESVEALTAVAQLYPGDDEQVPGLLTSAASDIEAGIAMLRDWQADDADGGRLAEAAHTLTTVHARIVEEVSALEASSGYQVAGSRAQRVDAEVSTASVVRWIDGDTVVTTRGTVRLIGIDTPELGVECQAAEDAAAAVEAWAPRGTEITLLNPPSVDNVDRYDRKLRYVELPGGDDVGFSLLRNDLAEARYDSTDGYDWHPSQRAYRASGASVGESEGCVLEDESLSGMLLVAVAAAADAEDDAHGRIDLFDGVERTLTTATVRFDKAIEAGRRAHEAREAEAAAERRAQEAREAEAAAERKAQQERSNSKPKSGTSSGSTGSSAKKDTSSDSGSGGSSDDRSQVPEDFDPDTYTGCRAYAPGGGSWKPIPCP